MTAVLSMAHPARHPYTSHSHSYGSYSPHSSDGRSMNNSFNSSPVPSLASSGPGKLSLPGIASLISDVDRDREPYRQTASPLPDSYRPSLSQTQRHPPLPSITSAPSSYYGHNEHARDPHHDYIKPPVNYLGRPLGAPPTPDISPALSSRSEFPSHARARLLNDGRGYATHSQSLPPYQMSPIPSPREDRLLPREPTLSGSLVHSPSLQSLHSQRPLPQNFPPAPPSVQTSPPTPESQNAHTVWQHHHYISPASQAGFPQTQDRYVCGSCSKAFSRPSSLKIHSHSHTGEKPFNCPHAGCRKSFSVRSNMKRHERGCHVGLAGDSSRAQSVESSES